MAFFCGPSSSSAAWSVPPNRTLAGLRLYAPDKHVLHAIPAVSAAYLRHGEYRHTPGLSHNALRH